MFFLRKSLLSFLAASAFLTLSCIVPINQIEVSASSLAYVNGTGINVREKPTTSSKSVGSLSNTTVVITDWADGWCKVSYGKLNGWVRADLITAKPQTSTAKTKSISQSAFLKGTKINIRSKPSTSAKVVTTLSNKQVNLIGSSGNWYKISYNGTQGWVSKDFVSTTGSTSNSGSSKTTNKSNSSSTAFIKGTNVNIRSTPSRTARIVGTVSNQKISVLSRSGDWCKVSTGKTTGWVLENFVSNSASNTSSKTSSSSTSSGYIKGSGVNIRSKPATSAKVVDNVSNKKVTVLAQSGDWYKVDLGKSTGWVSKDFVSFSSGSGSTTAKSSTNSSLRTRMVAYSRGFLGVRYRYGGSSPSGFDCSGFTSYVYKKFGIKLERVSTSQAKQGKYVPKDKLQPGDLVFFDTNGGKTKVVNHAGMYIGSGKFIHASSSRNGRVVKISSLNESFYKKAYVTGRTFIK